MPGEEAGVVLVDRGDVCQGGIQDVWSDLVSTLPSLDSALFSKTAQPLCGLSFPVVGLQPLRFALGLASLLV